MSFYCTLSRNNKPLDLSLTIRFANIPNNGQIDLQKSSVIRKDQNVTIAMDLEDGVRQIMEFNPNENLWNVIHNMFENKPILNLESNLEFVIIYVQKEIVGEKQLKETNLRGLGLIQGRAAMKLLVRSIDAPKEQAFVESLDLRKSSQTEEKKKNTEITSNQSVSEVPKKEATAAEPQPVIKPSLKQTETTVLSDESEPKVHKIETENSKREKSNEQMELHSDVQQMETSSESEDEGQEILNYLGGHNSEVVFKMSDLPKVAKKEFPDSFYETTKDDLAKVLTGLRKQQAADGLKPLETQQMREQKKREQMTKYETTVIRVVFPNDKLVFQAIFKPNDTIEDVKRVISRYIDSLDFYLYTSPPKNVLKSDSTLFASALVPAAVIHFGINSSDGSHRTVIKDEFKSKLSSYKSAAKIAAQTRNKSAGNQSTTDTTPQTSQTSAKNTRTSNEAKSSDQKESKVPKWFKTNK